jgi:hypothetical protein
MAKRFLVLGFVRADSRGRKKRATIAFKMNTEKKCKLRGENINVEEKENRQEFDRSRRFPVRTFVLHNFRFLLRFDMK